MGQPEWSQPLLRRPGWARTRRAVLQTWTCATLLSVARPGNAVNGQALPAAGPAPRQPALYQQRPLTGVQGVQHQPPPPPTRITAPGRVVASEFSKPRWRHSVPMLSCIGERRHTSNVLAYGRSPLAFGTATLRLRSRAQHGANHMSGCNCKGADFRLFPCAVLTFATRVRLLAVLVRSAATRPLTAMLVFAVGDIHGDLAKAVNALKVAGLMDDDSGQPVWTGGNAVCVQMGDVLDRGDQEIGGASFSVTTPSTADA